MMDKIMVQFDGANMRETDEGREYIDRGPITLDVGQIIGFYDHTILVPGYKVRVMEDYDSIRKKIRDLMLTR